MQLNGKRVRASSGRSCSIPKRSKENCPREASNIAFQRKTERKKETKVFKRAQDASYILAAPLGKTTNPVLITADTKELVRGLQQPRDGGLTLDRNRHAAGTQCFTYRRVSLPYLN